MSWPDMTDIRTRLRYILGEPTAARWTDAELLDFINFAERDIAVKTGCYEEVQTTLTTTASSRLVAFEGHKVNAVEYIGSTRTGLQRITPKMLGHLPLNGITPQFYFTWGTYIVIEPKPTTAYTLYAYVSRWPDYEMYDTTDEPLIPAEFHPLIVNAALTLAYLKSKKFATSGAMYQQYVTEAQALADTYVMRRKDYLTDLKAPDTVQVQEGR